MSNQFQARFPLKRNRVIPFTGIILFGFICGYTPSLSIRAGPGEINILRPGMFDKSQRIIYLRPFREILIFAAHKTDYNMNRELTSWYSPSLNKDMPIAVYGHYGLAILMVPTAAADYLEYERFQLIESIRPFIESGKVKVFSVNSINTESWLNPHMDPRQKVVRHNQFNDYIYNEVVPFIRNNTSWETPIITCGASFGALHSMNLFLKRPDLINGVIAMSGVYDLTEYTKGYYDEDVYFNSPQHYIPNLTDHGILEQIRSRGRLHILTGSGAHEDPAANGRFAKILYDKGIWYELDIWGEEWPHDWNTWRAMLPHYLGTRF